MSDFLFDGFDFLCQVNRTTFIRHHITYSPALLGHVITQSHCICALLWSVSEPEAATNSV